MKYKFHPEALEEYREAANWYADREPELGLRFIEAVETAVQRMVSITFPDRDTEKRALAFLLGRFSGRLLRSGEHTVPKEVLEALAAQKIPFTVKSARPNARHRRKR